MFRSWARTARFEVHDSTRICIKHQIQKSGTKGDSPVGHYRSYHIFTSSVIYYRTDARQHRIYLFYIIKKQTTTAFFFYFKIFSITRTPTFSSLWRTRKKPFDGICCLCKILRSKELWLLQKNHATVKLNSNGFSWNKKLTAKAELNWEVYKL